MQGQGRGGDGRIERERRVEAAALAAARVVDGGRVWGVFEPERGGIGKECAYLDSLRVWWVGDGRGWSEGAREVVVGCRESQHG